MAGFKSFFYKVIRQFHACHKAGVFYVDRSLGAALCKL